MPAKPTGLITVQKLAAHAERREAQRLADSLRRLEDKQAKLAELETYLQEYAGSMVTLGGQGMSVAELRRRHSFTGQLNDVIEQQKLAVNSAQRLVEDSRKRWLQAKRKADGLSDLILRKAQAVRLAEEKREQKQADAAAGLRHARK